MVQGRKIDIHTGSISLGLSAGRTLYTGARDVDIQYRVAGSSDIQSLKLNRHSQYHFEDHIDIIAEGGPLFVIHEGMSNERYTASSDFTGLPILPGMQFVGANVRISDMNSSIQDNSYISHSIGQAVDEEYSVSLSYPNGFYSARLRNKNPTYADRAGITLLAPQERSDRGAPVVALDSTLRIPVYQKQTVQMADIITEMSRYTVTIDPDTTLDQNNDGRYDDDFVSVGTGVTVRDTEIEFGPFTEPGRKNMVIRVIDEFGNTTESEIGIEVYSPIPRIDQAQVGVSVDGSIPNEVLESEPIHIWRVRTGEMPTLLHSEALLTDSESQFQWQETG